MSSWPWHFYCYTHHTGNLRLHFKTSSSWIWVIGSNSCHSTGSKADLVVWMFLSHWKASRLGLVCVVAHAGSGDSLSRQSKISFQSRTHGGRVLKFSSKIFTAPSGSFFLVVFLLNTVHVGPSRFSIHSSSQFGFHSQPVIFFFFHSHSIFSHSFSRLTQFLSSEFVFLSKTIPFPHPKALCSLPSTCPSFCPYFSIYKIFFCLSSYNPSVSLYSP